ncbi:MAG: hypothetical protein FWF06_07965, partial [Symbiobacteriaceae bacterium]|nr:hypothetical protein [Symbiobacteriaceae bacterium]
MSKKFSALLLALAMVFSLVTPAMAAGGFPGDSKPLALLKNQAPVYLDGAKTNLLEAVYNGNSANLPNWTKISANKEKVSIKLDGVIVGEFTFDKSGNGPKGYEDFLKITIFENLPKGAEVNIRWHCSKYYAYADLTVPGVYYIPQLMQDNGKTQSFDQIWIGITKPAPQTATVIVEKEWYIGQTQVNPQAVVSFTNGFVLGANVVNVGKVQFSEIVAAPWELVDISINGEPVALPKVSFVAEAGKTYTVVFQNWHDEVTPAGTLYIDKYVDGDIIAAWTAPTGYSIEDFIVGFHLYKAEDIVDGEPLPSAVAVDFVTIEEVMMTGGTIAFLAKPGKYAVIEEFTTLGEKFLEKTEPLFVEFNGVSVVGKGSVTYVSNSDYGTVVSATTADGVWNLPEVWHNQLSGSEVLESTRDNYAALMAMDAEWIWDAANTYLYGIDGNIFETQFTAEVAEDVTVPFYLAADNAAVVYVNGKLAGFTTVALRNSLTIGADYDSNVFAMLDYDNFDGRWSEGWTHAYSFDIDLVAGKNTITVIAANSKRTYDTGTDNDNYDLTNNPCGVIFGFAIEGSTTIFENTSIVVTEGELIINKKVNGTDVAFWLGDKELEDYIEGFYLYLIEEGVRVGAAIPGEY